VHLARLQERVALSPQLLTQPVCHPISTASTDNPPPQNQSALRVILTVSAAEKSGLGDRSVVAYSRLERPPCAPPGLFKDHGLGNGFLFLVNSVLSTPKGRAGASRGFSRESERSWARPRQA